MTRSSATSPARRRAGRPRRLLGWLLTAVGLSGCLLIGACGNPPTPTAPAPRSPTQSPAPPTGAVSAAPGPPAPSPTGRPSSSATSAPSSASRPSSTSAAPVPTPTAVRCADLVDGLGLRDRVGQLMMVAVASDGVSAAAADALDGTRAGSVLLLGNTTAGRARVSRVADRARTVARNPDRVETLLAADQEGGQVQRLRGDGFDRIPAAEQQAEETPAALTSDAERWGRQLRRAGIDANLAPVADVVPSDLRDVNQPIGVLRRGYGADPAKVAASVAAFVEGMDAAGVATSVKHFPGLGRVRGNTDVTANVVDDVTTAEDSYLTPFAAGIEAGTDMVMMSSATYAEIDPKRRAAFSPTIIRGLLREDLRFTGVVISDDLAAAAMRDLEPGARMLRFLRAGGDLAIVGDPGIAVSMAEAVVDEARDDERLATTIEAAAVRVLQLKDRRGLADC